MTSAEPRPAVAALAAFLAAARRILVFTGAGVSTGSGIPDFRGPQGIWKKRQPVYYQELLASEAKRIEYWEYKEEGWDAFRAARPNATHVAIAKLESLGRLAALVTQNIDGLHQKGGSSAARVIEVHGTNLAVECIACGARSDPDPAMAVFRATRRPPLCACGGFLKPATISFGQPLRPEVIARAMAEAETCDLSVSLGSTLSVHPAASIPLVPMRRGAPYVVINQGATDHDGIATLKIDADVGDVFPPAVDALAAGTAPNG